jgi:phage gp29-like protein
MRVPYWCYITKRKLRWLWYQFLDQTYLPKTIVKNPDELKARSDARKVATLRSKGVLGVSSDTEVEAFESSGHGAAQYIEAIRYLESEMSNSILAGFTDLTSQAAEGKGSYALSESQGKLFLRTRRMVAEDMARQITQGIIGDLVKYNFGAKAPVPTFAFGPLSEQNERDVLEMFRSVATTGAKVPPEFYDELTVRVASLLELREDKVREQLNAMPETPGDLGQMAQKVEVATGMVAGAQAAGQAPPARGGAAPGRRAPSSYGKESAANGGKQPR